VFTKRCRMRPHYASLGSRISARSRLESGQRPYRRLLARELVRGFTTLLVSLLIVRDAGARPAVRHSSRTPSSIPTGLRVETVPWWPTKGSPERKEYAGSGSCTQCHAEKTASQVVTSMARAAVPAANAELLKNHPDLSLKLGPYTYELATKNGQSSLSVSNGVESTTENLEWALGKGNFGQSYVYRENDKYYEAQLSFYSRVNGLDITTGHSRDVPQNIDAAAGGYTPLASIRQCFGCHFTASSTNDRFDPDHAIAGVTCEACHGPGLAHVALMSSGLPDAKGLIMNPANLDPVESVDFCGACHRTYADAVLSGQSKMGIINVRLQPYRLEKSRCWGSGDARLTCVACHDPHIEVVRSAEFYDAKCLRCHRQDPNTKRTADHPGSACKVGTKGCVTCHMPKLEVEETHATFTDHFIRIARPGEPYPE